MIEIIEDVPGDPIPKDAMVNFHTKASHPPGLIQRLMGKCKVLVDGVEVRQVWFFDLKTGAVETLDIFGDGIVHTIREGLTSWPPGTWNRNGILSRSIKASV